MKNPIRKLLLAALTLRIATFCLGSELDADSRTPFNDESFRAFIDTNCVKCHGPKKQKGDVRLDELPLTDLSPDHLELWQDAMDLVATGDMPDDEDLALSQSEIGHATRFIDNLIQDGLQSVSKEQVVLRRLNKEQYRNTLRDLLGINVSVEDPSSPLPPDEIAEGFDNLGSALTMTDLHLDAYLAAAEDAISRWEARADVKPGAFKLQVPTGKGVTRYGFGGSVMESETHLDLLTSGWTNRRFKMMTFPARDPRNQLLPYNGVYRITVDAEPLHTDDPEAIANLEIHQLPWDMDSFRTPQLGIFLRRPARSITPDIDYRVGTMDFAHGERSKVVLETWLPGGLYTLGFNFDTGPRFDPNNAAAAHYLKEKLDAEGKAIGDSKEFLSAARDLSNRGRKDRDLGAEVRTVFDRVETPRLRFHSITIEGPLEDENAPSRKQLDRLDSDQAALRAAVIDFAMRAFRRPVESDEIQPFVDYAYENGYRSAMKAILCSPSFLYLKEKEGELSDYALASRLSYFLWNSMPDEELFKLAEAGQLKNKAILRSQMNRMLEDERSKDFVDHFTFQWLGLENMTTMRPSEDFVFYHDFFVGELMIEETARFFDYLLKANRPASDLIDADYTFMNSTLARHYGRSDVTGSAFEKVSLAGDSKRRGLLGQGAVLTASANGVDTSPVIRGIWVLDRLFGTPPNPPPPNVVALEPDTRGTITIREMYAKHRTEESCRSCHKSIDPLGFALENFDPIGHWREQYANGIPVESYGQLPGGETFEDIEGLRELLADGQVDLVARNLVQRLLVYATGRKLSIADRREVDRILEENSGSEYGANDLVHSIITSSIFLNK